MKDLLDVVNVKPYTNYHLVVEFENGEKRLFDMSSLIEKQNFYFVKRQFFKKGRHIK